MSKEKFKTASLTHNSRLHMDSSDEDFEIFYEQSPQETDTDVFRDEAFITSFAKEMYQEESELFVNIACQLGKTMPLGKAILLLSIFASKVQENAISSFLE